ncbi:Retrovirus-related Pol polyprotein from transposon 17.6 [Gossypium australe]|uniref:Retrovirus-related Pol polyprotein from transposon 17.6 n=1 Tax=Gossypium australe TaxID=47621 RepID=A0A5B6W7L1_9ROSI|nr:Retrovirus-related Pol polyprotein from transposon 17.6 [Gossypium australe]
MMRQKKDHFPLPFIGQMLDKLVGKEYYFFFLDGYFGYHQISIHLNDQEKTTFTFSFGTYAFKRMPFGLCNASTTFMRCMTVIFANMLEEGLDICEETNLVLNCEKSHFMVKEGYILRHQISKKGLDVDKVKIEVINLPIPMTIRGVRNLLDHVGFYRRFIKNLVHISKPLNQLLQKETPFIFNQECIQTFKVIKKKRVSSPIIINLDWSGYFIIMCNPSDYVVGAVLGQKRNRTFFTTHYASKTLNSTQCNYTTTEKEMFAIVFACEKLHPYLMTNRVYVYTNHSAFKYR